MANDPKSIHGPQHVSLSDEEGVKQILTTTVMTLWEAVNNLTRLRPTKRDRYRVAIFGSARAKPGTFVYEEVKRVAAALTDMGCDIVTGGGPGLMQAANEGATSTGRDTGSMGIRVDLPFEQEVNPFVEQAFEHKTFFSRLHHFVIASDAFVVVPGGIGTVLESMMIWQLLQVRHVDNVPLIFVGKMWKGMVDWARTSMLDPRLALASPEDFNIPRCLDTADEAITAVRELHAAWLGNRPKH
ncbi:MAG: LOG family protein [Phycisphaerales bacterium]|nr:LOG family protein [Phycisphaerales bacterium]